MENIKISLFKLLENYLIRNDSFMTIKYKEIVKIWIDNKNKVERRSKKIDLFIYKIEINVNK